MFTVHAIPANLHQKIDEAIENLLVMGILKISPET